MKKLVLFLPLLLAGAAFAQQGAKPVPAAPTTQQAPAKQPGQGSVVDRKKLPLSERPNLSLADVNTDIAVDKRVIVMMAALNVAGYDYEPAGRPLSPLRKQIREDLKNVDPELVRRLRNHFLAHKAGRNDASAVAPYLSLALSLTEPPAFSIDVAADRLPDDVREITDFALLLEEFYNRTGFSKLLTKYATEFVKTAQTYPPAAGLALGGVLSYLHTDPVLELPPLYVPRRSPQAARKEAPKKAPQKAKGKDGEKEAENKELPQSDSTPLVVPNRVREFVILPDLLNSTGSANLRIVRDTYYLLLGPTNEPNVEAMRRAFLNFVIDPVTERQIKEVAAIRAKLKELLESRGARLDPEYAKRSAYFLITDSLVRATDARMDVLGIAARKKYSEDDAIYELSLGYDRGAVLVYHFYDQMKAFEAVGVNVRDYFTALLQGVDFDRETRRLDEYAQRLTRVKQLRTEATLAPAPPSTISNADEKLVARIVEADQMIKTRKYADAKAVLEAALKERPNNARVLYGLGDVTSKQATALEDSDRVEETLYAAVEYYKQAAQNASLETEKWLAQRSYVAAAKILDFISENNPSASAQAAADAAAAYDLALKLGKVEGGAYDEAEKAIKTRGQKSKP